MVRPGSRAEPSLPESFQVILGRDEGSHSRALDDPTTRVDQHDIRKTEHPEAEEDRLATPVGDVPRRCAPAGVPQSTPTRPSLTRRRVNSSLNQQIPVPRQGLQQLLHIGHVIVEMRSDAKIVVSAGGNNVRLRQFGDELLHVGGFDGDHGPVQARVRVGGQLPPSLSNAFYQQLIDANPKDMNLKNLQNHLIKM